MHTFVPQKYECYDKAMAEPVRPFDVKEMFSTCVDACPRNDDGSCVRQCVILADNMMERLVGVEGGQEEELE